MGVSNVRLIGFDFGRDHAKREPVSRQIWRGTRFGRGRVNITTCACQVYMDMQREGGPG